MLLFEPRKIHVVGGWRSEFELCDRNSCGPALRDQKLSTTQTLHPLEPGLFAWGRCCCFIGLFHSHSHSLSVGCALQVIRFLLSPSGDRLSPKIVRWESEKSWPKNRGGERRRRENERERILPDHSVKMEDRLSLETIHTKKLCFKAPQQQPALPFNDNNKSLRPD
jgi:hypothetical protein